MKRALVFLVSVLLVLLAIFLGYGGFNRWQGRPEIGLIQFQGVIWDPGFTQDLVTMFRYAADTPSIKAVVLVIESPGGEASQSEELYLNVLRLKGKKPVVVSVSRVAASGGYYVAVAGNYIYAKPTSFVGSIGAWSFLPSPEPLFEDLIPTGPFKLTGGSRQKATLQLEMVKEAFLQAVMSQRGDKLTLTKEELGRAEIHSGVEGLRYGLIDAIGSTSDAIDKAAELAQVRGYRLVDINEKLKVTTPPSYFFQAPIPPPPDLLPVFYYLYLEPAK